MNVAELKKKQSKLPEISTRLENLEEKFLKNDINRATFKKWQSRYYQERSILESEISDMKKPVAEIWEQFNTAIASLADLQSVYKVGTTEQEQSIIGWVFDRNLSYSDGLY